MMGNKMLLGERKTGKPWIEETRMIKLVKVGKLTRPWRLDLAAFGQVVPRYLTYLIRDKG